MPQAARAQILIGRDVYLDFFGAEPSGFWLPECGYVSGLEAILQQANIRWFVLDAHGCYMEDRARAGRFMRRVLRLRAGGICTRRTTQAEQSLERRVKAIPETQSIAISISRHRFDLPMETCWDLLRAELEKSLRCEIPPDYRTYLMRKKGVRIAQWPNKRRRRTCA